MENAFHENFANWSLLHPQAAVAVADADFSTLPFCHTEQGELNLIDICQASPTYLHSQQGALLEAHRWAATQELADNDVMFVYGLGLGYYYVPLKEWLKQDPGRHLVFIEDDPRVLCLFFQTDLAAEILACPQVTIHLAPCMREPNCPWPRIRAQVGEVMCMHVLRKAQFSCLSSYFQVRTDLCNFLALRWMVELTLLGKIVNEFLHSSPVYRNFYANVPYMGKAISAEKLYGQFRSVPAVLCGAGPSLAKQLPLLEQLQDRALIIAAGSAMNALSYATIIPHIGGAIDPTKTQGSRLLTSFAYDIPIFYRNRFYAEAFAQWHGPCLYVTGSGRVRIADWFEAQLGLASDIHFPGGISTTNFLCDIASYLGCDPVIFIGLDLAYTQDKRYVKGVLVHPTDNQEEHARVTKIQERLLPATDLDGNPIYTNHVWIDEAIYMTIAQQNHSHIRMLNATEGGMPIKAIPNVSFQDAVDEFMGVSWDMQGWVHGLIQNAATEGKGDIAVRAAISLWQESLTHCLKDLEALSQELTTNLERVKQAGALPWGIYTGRAALWQVELMEEPAYTYFFEMFDKIFNMTHRLSFHHLQRLPDGSQKQQAAIMLEVERCAFLKQYVMEHLCFVQEGMQTYEKQQQSLSVTVENAIRCLEQTPPPEYRSANGKIEIHAPELGLEISARFEPIMIRPSLYQRAGAERLEALFGYIGDKREGQTLYFYPNGQIQAEAFYHKGELHGPWSFYGIRGNLIGRSWFIEGKRQGHCCYYYKDGAIYSNQSYCHGLAHGMHLFYYQDGMLKTSKSYRNGKLEGSVRLYYSNGQIKKEQAFVQGRLHGRERMWEATGQLVFEAFYEQNHPVGISRKWHSDGKLDKEVVHEEK